MDFFLGGGGGGGFFVRTVIIGGPAPEITGARTVGDKEGGGGRGWRSSSRSRSREGLAAGGMRVLDLIWRSRSDNGWIAAGVTGIEVGTPGDVLAAWGGTPSGVGVGIVEVPGNCDSTISQESKASLAVRSLPLCEKNRRGPRKFSLRIDGADEGDGGGSGAVDVKRRDVVLRKNGEDREKASD